MIKKLLFLLLCFFVITRSESQSLYPDYRFTVLENSDTLLFPFAGGLNSPVFAELDLNGDNINDLLIYEKTTGRILTFLNNGSANITDYHFAPQYISSIPKLSEWVRSYDYDCDGDLDLFTYTISYVFSPLGEGAIKLYRNDYSASTGLAFTQVTNELITTYNNVPAVIPASPVNLPAIVDVDGDNDADILTFALSSSFVEYHRNFSMDSTGICGGFIFHHDPLCWGLFKLSGVENKAILNSNCLSIPDNANLHSGSALTAFDQSCDGDIDIINGDILGSNLLYLQNTGSASSAFISYQDSLFPSYDVPVNFYNLPSAYYIDGDNDGKKDLLVSGFLPGEDFNNVLFYRNTTDNCTNHFQYIQNRFLVHDMIDVGTGSTPTFFDVDQDGLMDLIIGNDYYYSIITSQKVSHLSWYKNTGTALLPQFTLMNNDFANISSLGILGAYPAFGDLDGDGDQDLLIGDVNGELIYYRNNGGIPNIFSFVVALYQNIDVGSNSMPQIIDIDRDGLNDLLIGERSGVLNYYRNTGTAANPIFTLITSNFGGVNVLRPPAIQGNSVPVLYDVNGSYELLVGSESGYIYHYLNIDGNLGGTFTLADSAFDSIFEPTRVSLARYDIDNDSYADLVTGNYCGGIRFYTHHNATGVITQEDDAGTLFDIYPNPVTSDLTIQFKKALKNKLARLKIVDATGRTLLSETIAVDSHAMISTQAIPNGFYLLQLTVDGNLYNKKLIKE